MRLWVQSLGQKNPPEEEMATHSSILAQKNPKDRGTWQARVHGIAKSQTQLGTHTHCAGKGMNHIAVQSGGGTL